MPTNHSALEALLTQLSNGHCARPFDALGCHKVDGSWTIRTWQPDVDDVVFLSASDQSVLGKTTQLADGLFELSGLNERPCWILEVTTGGTSSAREDIWQFAGASFEEGIESYDQLHHYLGAHPCEVSRPDGQKVKGVVFRVYAPNARSVSLIGDRNDWNPLQHPMTSDQDGIWKLFVPGAEVGDLYKYKVRDQGGDALPDKQDPFGFYHEQYPGFSSQVVDHSIYHWGDDDWISKRIQGNRYQEPMSIYEMHAGSWKQKDGKPMSWRELAPELIAYLRETGFTHIELLPISEHPFTGSWGYQPVGLFAPTSRYGGVEDFKFFVDSLHQAGIGVIVDWVPAHFPSDDHGLARFDGTPLYEYADPRKGWHPDWNSYIYDFGKPWVRDFLVSNALFWLETFHVDGLRVDAVASMLYLDYSRNEGEWIPNVNGGNENLEAIELIKRVNEAVYREHPSCMTIAEESTSWPGVSKATFEGGLGFGFKWNMGWMHDSLSFMEKDPYYRGHHLDQMTFSMVYHYHEHFVMSLSHDEVVYGKGSMLNKMPGDEWQKYANLRAYMGFMFGHPGKKLLFMGTEIGTYLEWDHDDQLEWARTEDHRLSAQLTAFFHDLNSLYRSTPSLYELDFEETGFQWIITDDRDNVVLAFIRRDKENQPVVIICNFTPVVRYDYRVGIPQGGNWVEALNTDSSNFGGSDVKNPEQIIAQTEASHGFDQSLSLVLPPLATLILKPE